MTAKGHVLLSVPISMGIIAALNVLTDASPTTQVEMTIYLCAVFVGALFPDIDEPGSSIGRKLGGVSEVVSLIFRHRGPTHYFVTALLVLFAAIYWLDGYYLVAGIGFSVGWFAHTVGDLPTKGGIKGYFWPISRKTIGFPSKQFRFYTGGEVEALLILLLYVVDAAMLGAYYAGVWEI